MDIKTKNQIDELKRIVYGNSPDTTNLNAFKGLIKNQIKILELELEQEQDEEEKIILEILELQRDKLHGLNKEELEEVRKTFTNELGYCECGNNFKNETDEETGFCGDCK